ncbi:putative caffeine synthase 2 [Acorus gramineus]|uniref:Caffeine synthase 2 n=1 Tax=Acorus gramineus TaxID=55184 RepID=A0AAV9B8G8_ACOGR|nr:putative caffeine synthase 2 [Acorus gramineus]
MLFLNDLPSSDFNTLFQYLPTFYEGLKGVNEEEQLMMQTYVAAVPGSFFERLFPDNSIHLIHASYSVRWLAQVGLNQWRGLTRHMKLQIRTLKKD